MIVWTLSLLSVLVVSLVSLAGLFTLTAGADAPKRLSLGLVCFAVGTLLGDAFIHLIPEAFQTYPRALTPSLLILVGMMLFFLVENLIRYRRAFGAAALPAGARNNERLEFVAVNLIGDAVHNFIDGVLIAASYLSSPVLGVSTTLAVLLHELPQELGDFGILIHSGLSVRKAAALNLASALAAIMGAIMTLTAGQAIGPLVTRALIPVTAGGFVYLAAADLMPELRGASTIRELLLRTALIALGMAMMALLAAIG